MSFSVIVPALNEQDGIASVLDRIAALHPKPEIVVVDDGSADRTADIARAHGAYVLVHPQTAGYGRSLKDGIGAAKHDTVVITDSDGTYPIERIPDLLRELEKGNDMVVGARHGKHYRGSFLKMPARLLFKWLVEFTTGRRIPDINSGLRVFRKSQVQPYFPDICNGFSFTTTITLIYCLTGKFVHYVPIDYGARTGSSKVRIIRDSLRTLQYILETITVYNPLKLFILLAGGLGSLAVLACLGAILFGDALLLLIAVLLLVGAVMVFSMGLLSHPARSPR
jgi:polyisoprenyl-phosphate glycosyltransferase